MAFREFLYPFDPISCGVLADKLKEENNPNSQLIELLETLFVFQTNNDPTHAAMSEMIERFWLDMNLAWSVGLFERASARIPEEDIWLSLGWSSLVLTKDFPLPDGLIFTTRYRDQYLESSNSKDRISRADIRFSFAAVYDGRLCLGVESSGEWFGLRPLAVGYALKEFSLGRYRTIEFGRDVYTVRWGRSYPAIQFIFDGELMMVASLSK